VKLVGDDASGGTPDFVAFAFDEAAFSPPGCSILSVAMLIPFAHSSSISFLVTGMRTPLYRPFLSTLISVR
jgi:hypothetical protein